jgi:hypothetical protein
LSRSDSTREHADREQNGDDEATELGSCGHDEFLLSTVREITTGPRSPSHSRPQTDRCLGLWVVWDLMLASSAARRPRSFLQAYEACARHATDCAATDRWDRNDSLLSPPQNCIRAG